MEDKKVFAYNDKDFSNEKSSKISEEFKITNDKLADWALKKIAEEKQEKDRIIELAEAEIAEIKEKIEAVEKRFENNTSFFKGKLLEYFETVEHRKTKTKESYKLLSGNLVKKFGGAKMEPDEKSLVEYLEKSQLDEFVKITKKPAWAEFKKQLEIVGNSVMDITTGEIIDAIKVVEKPDTFEVEV